MSDYKVKETIDREVKTIIRGGNSDPVTIPGYRRDLLTLWSKPTGIMAIDFLLGLKKDKGKGDKK